VYASEGCMMKIFNEILSLVDSREHPFDLEESSTIHTEFSLENIEWEILNTEQERKIKEERTQFFFLPERASVLYINSSHKNESEEK